MSLEYCHECDKMVDIDYDSDHEHFYPNVLNHYKHNY